MPVSRGGGNISKSYVGSTPILREYVGNKLIFDAGSVVVPPAPAFEFITHWSGQASAPDIIIGEQEQLWLFTTNSYEGTNGIILSAAIAGISLELVAYATRDATYKTGVFIFQITGFTGSTAQLTIGNYGNYPQYIQNWLYKTSYIFNTTPLGRYDIPTVSPGSWTSDITLNNGGIALALTSLVNASGDTSTITGVDNIHYDSPSIALTRFGWSMASEDGQVISPTWTTTGSVHVSAGILVGFNKA